MRTLIWLVVAPLVGAALLTALIGPPLLPSARACECAGDHFWVAEDVTFSGAVAEFPKDGHLYPDRLQLWAEGIEITLEYAP